jgi:hypothetical protein
MPLKFDTINHYKILRNRHYRNNPYKIYDFSIYKKYCRILVCSTNSHIFVLNLHTEPLLPLIQKAARAVYIAKQNAIKALQQSHTQTHHHVCCSHFALLVRRHVERAVLTHGSLALVSG